MFNVTNIFYYFLLALNTMLQEFCFPLIFEIEPKIGIYRLLTHRPAAHRKFFPLFLFILISKFWSNVSPRPHYAENSQARLFLYQ